MWVFDYTILEIVVRTAIIYFAILIGLRLTGKREVGQMTPFDLVLLILIANAVQNAMTGPDTSVTGGLVAAGTLLVLNFLLSHVVFRNRHLRRLVEGTPTILVKDGQLILKNLRSEHITPDEIRQALREHGVPTPEEVGLAVLEIDGSISVLRKDELPLKERPHHRFRFKHLRRQ
jgi:uncharacterized membrane protein YcaP (DUF421 family)